MKMMEFGKQSIEGYKQPLEGIRQKTLVFGRRMLMTEFVLDKGHDLPLHGHPYEQTGYLVKGHIILTVGDKQYDTLPGDSWCIAPNITHGARVLEDSVAIEVFSPVRQDYIPRENT